MAQTAAPQGESGQPLIKNKPVDTHPSDIRCSWQRCSPRPSRGAILQLGADAASLRWRRSAPPDVQVIFPDTAGAIARRTLHFIEAARPSIGYGFRHGPLKIPFVMHPENFRSNGLVMWLPKRVEFLTSPAIDSYSMPWYKQPWRTNTATPCSTTTSTAASSRG